MLCVLLKFGKSALPLTMSFKLSLLRLEKRRVFRSSWSHGKFNWAASFLSFEKQMC